MTATGTASAVWALLLIVTPGVLGAADAPPLETADVQKECPVMVGNKIDPNVFTVYQGKKVYFCCTSCKAAFDAQPEKYLSRLPQFASRAVAAVSAGPRAKDLIVPLGIAAFATITATVLTGLYRKLRPRLMFRLHKVLGIIALIIAACHGAIVILLD